MGPILRRFVPRLDARWVLLLVLVAAIVAAAGFLRWTDPPPHLVLRVLGPDGAFHDTLAMPSDWADSATTTPDGVVRFPLTLGVQNEGQTAVRPARLALGVPARFRLTGSDGRELPGTADPTSPLIRYDLTPHMEPVEPGRLPVLLPAYETLWLEAVVPRYYCVELADSIPELVAAPPPPLGGMRQVRLLYVLDGGDLAERQTGTLTLELDTTRMAVDIPPAPPDFPMETDPDLANPDLGPLTFIASHETRCGEPEAPLELLSSIWESEGGARMIGLEYGGMVRKRLYDLNGDGVIDRESWDPSGDGRFTATRRARLPIPEFLLPRPEPAGYDLAEFEGLPPDSLARLDPLRAAMPGPGPLAVDSPGAAGPAATAPAAPPTPATPAGPPGDAPAGAESEVEPVQPDVEPVEPDVEPAEPAPAGEPLGRPAPIDP